MMEEAIDNFREMLKTVQVKGLPNSPTLIFWDMNLNNIPRESFSPNCLINSSDLMTFHADDDIKAILESIKTNCEDLDSKMYNEYINNFEYETHPAGFVIAHHMGFIFSYLPIVEVSGPDAETINNAVQLVT